MTNTQNRPATAPTQIRLETAEAIRNALRVAGAVTYSAPKGQMVTILETKMLSFLSEFLASADRTLTERAGPGQEQAQRLYLVETALSKLVTAVCPGLDHHDLLADAGIALAAMASAEPAAYFGIDDEPLDNGNPRFLQIAAEHKTDEDVFPLYRRAPTLAELAAHIDQHQVAASGATVVSGTSPAVKATKQKAAAK